MSGIRKRKTGVTPERLETWSGRAAAMNGPTLTLRAPDLALDLSARTLGNDFDSEALSVIILVGKSPGSDSTGVQAKRTISPGR